MGLIQNREKLPKPDMATAEIYELMLRCWKIDASVRVQAQQLSDYFEACDIPKLQWPKATHASQVRCCSIVSKF